MEKKLCSDCHVEMKEVAAPDLTIDQCPKCQGIYLEPGELNTFSTGISGDIEYNSVDSDTPTDAHKLRDCPSCVKPMSKVKLLQFSNLVFDFCRGCKGFFLDTGELEATNDALRQLSPTKQDEEFRGNKGDYLVRIEKFKGTQMGSIPVRGMGMAAVPTVTHRVLVFFKKPLGAGLHLSGESLTSKLLKAFNLFKRQDIETGDSKFDSQFIIQTTNPPEAKRILAPSVRQTILKFLKDEPSIFDQFGKLEIFSNYICYLEGPYQDTPTASKQVGYAQKVTNRLVEIAEAFDKASSVSEKAKSA